MNLMVARALDKREDGISYMLLNPGIVALSVHPGVVDSDFINDFGWLVSLF